jgi:Fic family protein
MSGMIAYLQPFMDGNKRTSRLAANAILLGNDFSALSYRAISDIEQFIDAAENYFAI